MPDWHSASPFSCGRNSFSTKPETVASRCGSALKEGWISKPARPPGQGAPPPQRRIGVGGVDDARQVADQRLQRLAQFGKTLRQVARQRARASSTEAITPHAPEQRALGRRVHDHVGDEAGKIDVVGADRQQHQIELAVGLAAFGGGQRLAQFGELAVDGARAGARRFRRRAFAGALRAEQAVGDGGAGAGQRQIGHRDVRILHGERQRGAGLVAVERAVAGGIEPQRALALPDRKRVRRFAGAPALVAGAARAVILRVRRRDRSGSKTLRRPARSAGPDCLRRRRCCRQARR